jgi:protein gp37
VPLPFWGAVIKDDGTIAGDNELGKLWMSIREDLRTRGKASAVSPQGDKITVEANAPVGAVDLFRKPRILGGYELTADEKKKLAKCEAAIDAGRRAVENGFVAMVKAMYDVFQQRLYREGGRTFGQYFQDKWKFERAHSYRMVKCGGMLATMKNAILGDLTSQGHFRPLLTAGSMERIENSLSLIEQWKKYLPDLDITPSVVESAVAVTKPATSKGKASAEANISSTQVLELVAAAGEQIKNKPKSSSKILANLQSNIEALSRKGTTDINWTDMTWNPLQGCQKISDGCKFCYAATLLATRLRPRYPGIAEKIPNTSKKNSPFNFTGEIRLLVDALGEPLAIKKPRRYFVNSLSDLFYKEVKDWFVDAVFSVMEQANWHQFQILTKRPERMAAYTQKRYAVRKPPANIWLGTSIEDQATHDKRMPHVKNIKTAVRWLSCEPLLGPVDLDLTDIHWVVVGGESGSTPTRKMDKDWAMSIRDQCKKAKVLFYFKQWGVCGEDGEPNKHKKSDGHETLDGEIHRIFPGP